MFTQEDFESVLQKCRAIRPAQNNYLENDFIINLFCTVLDFQMSSVTVVRALNFYRNNRWNDIRTLEQLKNILNRFEDSKEGNIAAAQYLWNYKLWTRVGMLRQLIVFFEARGVVDQPSLKRWASNSSFKTDFEGKIKGLGYAVYNWLVMRQGIETVKPDVHLRRFVQNIVGHDFTDTELVDILEKVARTMNKKAYELDWSIWEYQRTKTNSISL
ncbi:MAG TPA: hypothetical protein ENN97_05360 [Phycisphaerales bacterium]|nr:hypothetical protein [Phycisphaerales bacterium]